MAFLIGLLIGIAVGYILCVCEFIAHVRNGTIEGVVERIRARCK
jgi:hypothetical protein